MKEPEKFVRLVEGNRVEDITLMVISIIRHRLFQIIKADLWEELI